MVLSFWLTHTVRPFGDPFEGTEDEQHRRNEGLNTIELWFLGGCCMLVVLGAFCRFTALNHHVVACFYYGILVAVSCGVARPMFKLWTSDSAGKFSCATCVKTVSSDLCHSLKCLFECLTCRCCCRCNCRQNCRGDFSGKDGNNGNSDKTPAESKARRLFKQGISAGKKYIV